MAPSLSFAMFMSSPFVRLQHEVTIDNHAHRKTWPDRQRRLNVKIPLNDFLPGLVQAIAGSEPKRLNETPVIAGTALGAGAELTTNAKQRGQQCGFEQGPQAVINVILEAGITR